MASVCQPSASRPAAGPWGFSAAPPLAGCPLCWLRLLLPLLLLLLLRSSCFGGSPPGGQSPGGAGFARSAVRLAAPAAFSPSLAGLRVLSAGAASLPAVRASPDPPSAWPPRLRFPPSLAG